MTLKQKDFIEIEFTGKTKEGNVFDSNIKEDLKKLHEGHNHEIETKPLIYSLGEGMFLKAIDEFLVGKPETSAEYEIELQPEKAFGVRNAQFVQMIPLKAFKGSDAMPMPGMVFNFDGRMAKILSVSGGRVMVDFNNPLAGKVVNYKIKVLRKVDNLDEKIKSLISFLFRRDLSFEVKDKTLTLMVEKPMVEFVKLFEDKFKDLFDLKVEVKEIEEKNPEENHEEEHEHEHSHEHHHEHNHE